MAESRAQVTRRRRFSVDALFADTSPRAVGVNDLTDAKEIDLTRIEADPDQPRKAFDPGGIEELAASIRLDGILQPLAVRYDESRDVYIIVHGERRWRAAQIAGLQRVPAIVRDVPEERRLVQQLVENIVREDLNALDRAAALRILKAQMDDAPWDRVAEAVGIRRSRLFQLLGTEKLDGTLQEALRRGIVSEKQTRVVQGLPDTLQRDIGSAVLDGTLLPQDIASRVRAIKSRPQEASPETAPTAAETVRDTVLHARSLTSALRKLGTDLDSLDASDRKRLMTALRDVQTRIDAVLDAR